jgi:hypothetical protein
VIAVRPRGCSLPLQRAMSDFGFEHSFKNAVSRLHEHYGFKIGETAVTRVTLKHAHRIGENQNSRPSVGALPACGAERLVAESDGCLLRIVETADTAGDRRRTRKVDFQEARLNAAQAVGKATIVYEAGFTDVDQTGWLWAQAVREAGWGLDSNIHALGDGAPWIWEVARVNFPDAVWILDLYHAFEHVNDMATLIYPNESANSGHAKKWRGWLKADKIDRFIKEISTLADATPAKKIDVLKSLNYFITNRDRMLYATFRKAGYFVGSGVVEAGCKTVVGKRAKQSGMFWHVQGAHNVLSIRCAVLGNLFDDYWTRRKAA